jgi:hypothetical protein
MALLAYLYWKSRTEGAETGLLIRREITLFFAALGVFVAINLPFCLAAGLHGWYSDVIVSLEVFRLGISEQLAWNAN